MKFGAIYFHYQKFTFELLFQPYAQDYGISHKVMGTYAVFKYWPEEGILPDKMLHNHWTRTCLDFFLPLFTGCIFQVEDTVHVFCSLLLLIRRYRVYEFRWEEQEADKQDSPQQWPRSAVISCLCNPARSTAEPRWGPRARNLRNLQQVTNRPASARVLQCAPSPSGSLWACLTHRTPALNKTSVFPWCYF